MDEVDTRTGNFIFHGGCKDFETRLARIYSLIMPDANRFAESFNVSEVTRAKIAVKNIVCLLFPYASSRANTRWRMS